MEIIVDETTDKLLIEAQQVKNILEQFSMDNQTFREDADSQVETFYRRYLLLPKWIQLWIYQKYNLSQSEMEEFIENEHLRKWGQELDEK
ncbi:hypothetical protein [Enterococcus cecorum]|uniref:hypothetical protein n=1 Tax=Enterococcus cecorum TaxID=44008 RepID=UPI002ACA2375|nr:hypothetical protein [Enterococcus cecorum]MDZ5583888.1 hypothetical protein [Enterococcus cecorum]